MHDKKITFSYVIATTIAVIFTWFIHEFAHWLTSKSLGYEAIMRINGTSFTKGENPTDLYQEVETALVIRKSTAAKA